MPRISDKKHLENKLARNKKFDEMHEKLWQKGTTHLLHTFDASAESAKPTRDTAVNVEGNTPECTRAYEQFISGRFHEHFMDFNKVPRQHKAVIDAFIADAARDGQTMSVLYTTIDRYKKNKGIGFTLPFNDVKPKFRARVAEARREEIRLEQEERVGLPGLGFSNETEEESKEEGRGRGGGAGGEERGGW